jgi:hypothetical protein
MATNTCKETYYNLLEFSFVLDDDPECAGKGEDIFEKLMLNYFFKNESEEKAVQAIFKTFNTPDLFKDIKTIREISVDQIREMVEADTINDSFAGKIMLNKKYLKTFYPHHQPEYKKMPTEVQMKILDKIKEKNESIINAFEKMYKDQEADRKRTVLTLVALAIKNVHLRTGFPLKKTKEPVEQIIRNEFDNADEIFNADPKVMTHLNDDKSIRKIVKEIFKIKKHSDIVDVSKMIKSEFSRYEQRLLKSL